jgi:hypothetical protein
VIASSFFSSFVHQLIHCNTSLVNSICIGAILKALQCESARPATGQSLESPVLVSRLLHPVAMAQNFLAAIYRTAVPLVIGAGILQSAIYDVKGGTRVVIFDRLSGVKEEVVNEGTHFLIPWLQRSIHFDVRTKPRNISTTTGSKDLQMVTLTLRVLHRPDVTLLPKIYQVRMTISIIFHFRPELTGHTEPRPRLRRARPAIHRKRSSQGHRGAV